MENTLFGLDIPKNTEPIEDVDITTFILYLSTKQLKEFRRLGKEGIKRLWGQEFQAKGNVTDYILFLMRKDNESSENT